MIGFLCKNILSACLIKLNEVFYFFDGGYRYLDGMLGWGAAVSFLGRPETALLRFYPPSHKTTGKAVDECASCKHASA
jgi:hypothetical protein